MVFLVCNSYEGSPWLLLVPDGRRDSKADCTPPIRLAELSANATPLSGSSYVLLSSAWTWQPMYLIDSSRRRECTLENQYGREVSEPDFDEIAEIMTRGHESGARTPLLRPRRRCEPTGLRTAIPTLH